MDDIKIIDLFFARSELAIEALDGKYGAICHNLSRSILKDQQDAEECVNIAFIVAIHSRNYLGKSALSRAAWSHDCVFLAL